MDGLVNLLSLLSKITFLSVYDNVHYFRGVGLRLTINVLPFNGGKGNVLPFNTFTYHSHDKGGYVPRARNCETMDRFFDVMAGYSCRWVAFSDVVRI